MATPVEQMRVLIPDNEPIFEGDYLFTDVELDTYLTIANGSVLRAAAFAMIALGNSEAMISKVIRTQDLQTNGATVADAYRRNATVLLDRAKAEDDAADSFYIDTIDYTEGWSAARPELTEFNWWTR